MVIILDNPAQPIATMALRPGQYVWSPDGSALAGYTAYGEVLVVSAVSGEERQLRPQPAGKLEPYLSEIAWRRDGRSLIYSGQGGGPEPVLELRSLALPTGAGANLVLIP